MYFWNTKALRQQLKAGKVTERQKMSYLMATILLFTLSVYVPLPQADTALQAIEIIAAIGITIGGIFYCFRINQNGDGKNFLERFVCLSWPIAVKQILLIFLIVISYISLLAIFSPEAAASLENPTAFDVILLVLLEAWFYWRIGVHIRWISSRSV